MTQEEITEGNKLIAEFMTGHYRDKRKKSYPFPFPVIEVVPAEKIMGYGSVPEGKIKHYEGTPDMMKYHSSWDWLMPVYAKIRQVKIEDDHGVSAKIESVFKYVDFAFETDSILSLWKVIVEYLKWYNQNKNNNG